MALSRNPDAFDRLLPIQWIERLYPNEVLMRPPYYIPWLKKKHLGPPSEEECNEIRSDMVKELGIVWRRDRLYTYYEINRMRMSAYYAKLKVSRRR